MATTWGLKRKELRLTHSIVGRCYRIKHLKKFKLNQVDFGMFCRFCNLQAQLIPSQLQGRIQRAMPPKKRAKTAHNAKVTQPQNVADVAAGRLQLRDWITLVHQGRHGFPEKRKFPLADGGSFLDVVQRCFGDEDVMIEDSLELVKKLGIMDSSSTVEDFSNKYLTMQEWVIQPSMINCLIGY